MLDYIAAFFFVALLGAVAGAVGAYTHRLLLNKSFGKLDTSVEAMKALAEKYTVKLEEIKKVL